MGTADKTIRVIVAIVVGILIYAEVLTGTLAYVLLALSAIFLITSFLSFCPLYSIFGINSCKKEK